MHARQRSHIGQVKKAVEDTRQSEAVGAVSAVDFTSRVLGALEDCYGRIERVEFQTDEDSERFVFVDRNGKHKRLNTQRVVCLVYSKFDIEITTAHNVVMYVIRCT